MMSRCTRMLNGGDKTCIYRWREALALCYNGAMNRRDFMKGAALAFGAAPFAGFGAQAAAGAELPAGDGSTVGYSRSLPVKVDTDVFIAGGGSAGVAAAVAARAAGAKVFLAEGFTCFGGMGTAARVPVFMQWGDGTRDLACGFGTRFRDHW